LNGKERPLSRQKAVTSLLGIPEGRRAILPMHGGRKEMKRGTVAAIKKQLDVE
jgi:predicted RNA binding protein YcfA (HicA-like mRNA interferase family)